MQKDEITQDPAPQSETFRTGSNQSGMRNYNERLIIDTVRRSGPRSKAEIARMTQLSAQTVTVIVNRLIADGILIKMDSIRGKVGQPSTPIAINPDGAISIGVKIGRRSVDVIVTNFTHQVIAKRSFRYAYPTAHAVLGWLETNLLSVMDELSPEQQRRVLGIGVAIPTALDGWETVIGAPAGAMAEWSQVDLAAVLTHQTGLPVYMLNDGSAACLAQMTLADMRTDKTFLYIYVATFVGGGLVINGELFEGRTGNAGALGSMPLSAVARGGPAPAQMIERASLHRLETQADRSGMARDGFDHFLAAPHAQTMVQGWINDAAPALAMAITSGQALLDLDHVVIDGALPEEVLQGLIDHIRVALSDYNTEGIELPQIIIGKLGNDARALGAAMLPLRANFAVDQAAFVIGH